MLAVLIVFIHNNYTVSTISKIGANIVFNQSIFGKWFQLFISDGIGYCAVPLFFLFSAFLQASKNEKYSILLQKKAKSLIIPYFLWIFIYGFYYTFGIQIVLHFIPSFVNNLNIENAQNIAQNWSILDFVHKIFGYAKNNNHPGFAGQFWFVRDLIILTILSPIFNYFVKKRFLEFLIFIIFLFFSPINLFFTSNSALFFYILGLYWGSFKIDLFKIIDKIAWLDILLFFAFVFIYRYKFYAENNIVICFIILSSCIIALKFSAIIEKNKKCFSIAKYLEKYSFWLYAIHMPALIEILKVLWLKIFPMKNGFWCLAEYFGVSILTIFISLALGIGIKKIFPKLFALLCGGR